MHIVDVYLSYVHERKSQCRTDDDEDGDNSCNNKITTTLTIGHDTESFP